MHTAVPYLKEISRLKYGEPAEMGWGPRMRMRSGYWTPDDWYEATVFQLVNGQTDWMDVGCGRNIFPSNYPGAKILSERCRLLVGLDPSDNIDENTLVHEKAKCLLAEYEPNRQFDLITLRMVAEHIADPGAAVMALARLAKPGGCVVIYTVNKWSLVTFISAVTPMWLHHIAKRFLWDTDEKDTFPVAYRMNTRAELRGLFCQAGFREESFQCLDDCRSSVKWRWLSAVELAVWRILQSMRLHYPETCILAIYRKALGNSLVDPN
jgi:SAM-dependent methyltransferase